MPIRPDPNLSPKGPVEPIPEDFGFLKAAARACTACAETLPLGPRPIVRGHASARVLIVGQAPGIRVHRSGVPWDDPSGDRLRAWLGVDKAQFYDESQIAIVPMGLCYPGENPKGGDNPPAPACAPLWQGAFLSALTQLRLIILVGGYAQKWHLPAGRRQKSMTNTVADWAAVSAQPLGAVGAVPFPLPHPSWRNSAWINRNPWFMQETVPGLRTAFQNALR